MLPKLPLSVAIIANNEEDRLPACLESVQFADEIIVVDSGSTDGTMAIAEAAGCRVFAEEWKGFGRQKQSAVDKCRHDWVLVLDADERVPAETRQVIAGLLASPDADGYSFPRRNFYHGKWVRHGGWWPDRVVRLFRKDRGAVDDVVVHEAIHVTGEVKALDVPLEHHPIRDLQDVLTKINRYSSLGAERLYAAGRRASLPTAFIKGGAAFVKSLILQRGFLDGSAGWIIAFSHAVNTCYKYLKLREKEEFRT